MTGARSKMNGGKGIISSSVGLVVVFKNGIGLGLNLKGGGMIR